MAKKKRMSRKYIASDRKAEVVAISEYKIAGAHPTPDSVVAVFPLPSGTVQRIVFEYIHYEKQLINELVEGFWMWGEDKAVETRARRGNTLLLFLKFLNQSKANNVFHVQCIEDISENVLSHYITWLNKQPNKRAKNKSALLAPGSKDLYFGTVTSILMVLNERDEARLEPSKQSKIISPELFPSNPFKKNDKTSKLGRVLSPQQTAKIETACIKEITKSISEFADGQALVLAGLRTIEIGHELDYCRPELQEIRNSQLVKKAYAYLWSCVDLDLEIPDIKSLCEILGVRYSTIRKRRFMWEEFLDEFYAEKPLRNIESIYFPHEVDWDEQALKQLLVYLIRYHNGILPNSEKRSYELTNFINKANEHGFKESDDGIIYYAKRALYATPEVIGPYVIYLTSRGFFNADSILPASRFSKKEHPLASRNRILIQLKKKRAKGYQLRSFSKTDKFPIEDLFEQLLLITEPLVPYIEGLQEERLFIFQTGQNVISGFGNELRLGSSSAAWRDELKSFIKRNELPQFTLRVLRSTGAERAHRVSGGDYKASQKALGQASIDTTQKHYQSHIMRRRDRETIAQHQGNIVTWALGEEGTGTIVSGRKEAPSKSIDIDKSGKEQYAETQDAVTTGSQCKNPYKSPYEKEGTLCQAWLGCFGCPNAVIFLDDPKTVAELMQLQVALNRARKRINEFRFLHLYQDSLTIIEEDLLAEVDDPQVIAEAKTILPTLPPIPEIE